MKPNSLIKERSPYLRQHAYDSIDWYPWCEEAFNKALLLNKPIFLSIGYSTCHWCHVMAQESFRDEEVAKLLNDVCVCIKVDREERPDIDNFYTKVCYALSGTAGWPLTILMTPDRKPFFAATYLSKQTISDRIGLLELLNRIKLLWNKRKDFVEIAVDETFKGLEKIYKLEIEPAHNVDFVNIEKTYQELRENYDDENGGFYAPPKFPLAYYFDFLLRYWKKTNDPEALKMVEESLLNMRAGGIYDQIGFGFHRYAVDAKWNLPHFEKMLYDQSLLLEIYIDAYLAIREKIYMKVAKEICEYVLKNLSSSEGAFYSAEDSDSEGMEGKYYLWFEDEINEILNKDESKIAKELFNVYNEGNLMDGTGVNVLRIDPNFLKSLYNDAESSENLKRYELIRQKLYQTRLKRIPPFKDKKVLADWNALMIAALSKAARTFNEPKYFDVALRSLRFVLTKMLVPDVKLFHVYFDGEAYIPGKIDDYSFLIYALIDLYQTVFDADYIKIAIKMVEYLNQHFWDKENGGYYYTADYDCELDMRMKQYSDGSIPSGNSIMCLNLLRLAHITGDVYYENLYHKIIQSIPQHIASSGLLAVKMLTAAQSDADNNFHLVIAYKNEEYEKIFRLIKRIRANYCPNLIIILKEEGEESSLLQVAPHLEPYKRINNEATYFLCRKYACEAPINEIEQVIKCLQLK